MLAGRAYTYHLYPLVYQELDAAFDLKRALRVGLLPALWDSDNEQPAEFLQTYTATYLKEEVAAEGLVRQIGPFARFLDIAAANDGETVNFSNVARECGVSVPTVQQYYQILEDTFVGIRLPAWHRSIRRRLVAHPRYYLFDMGVTNCLAHTLQSVRNPIIQGRRFEQFVITQVAALVHYGRHDAQLAYWRTKHGAEVDLLLCRGDHVLAAIEIKSTARVLARDMSGLRSFGEEYPAVPCFLVGVEPRRRLRKDGITVLGWREFMDNELPGLLKDACLNAA